MRTYKLIWKLQVVMHFFHDLKTNLILNLTEIMRKALNLVLLEGYANAHKQSAYQIGTFYLPCPMQKQSR